MDCYNRSLSKQISNRHKLFDKYFENLVSNSIIRYHMSQRKSITYSRFGFAVMRSNRCNIWTIRSLSVGSRNPFNKYPTSAKLKFDRKHNPDAQSSALNSHSIGFLASITIHSSVCNIYKCRSILQLLTECSNMPSRSSICKLVSNRSTARAYNGRCSS